MSLMFRHLLQVVTCCRLTFSRLSLVAVPPCVNCKVSDDQFQQLFFRLWLSPLCCRSRTMSMLHWLVFLITYSIAVRAQRCSFVNRSAHITDTLASFHWLHTPECIKFKLRSLYWALHSTAPRYVSDRLSRVADLCYQSRLEVDFG